LKGEESDEERPLPQDEDEDDEGEDDGFEED